VPIAELATPDPNALVQQVLTVWAQCLELLQARMEGA
jgi:hypothetical protein